MLNKHQPSRVRLWPFIVFVVVIVILFGRISDKVTLGPQWISILVYVGLLIAFVIALVKDNHAWIRRLYLSMIFVLSIKLVSSVYLLVADLFVSTPKGKPLFVDAGLLWVINVLVFALWYWGVDQGGEQQRYDNDEAQPLDLLFPQMTTKSSVWRGWKLSFTDYVFLAFNTSTAFSPTDTLVMSKRMKVFFITQASISLVIVAVLAARAVGS